MPLEEEKLFKKKVLERAGGVCHPRIFELKLCSLLSLRLPLTTKLSSALRLIRCGGSSGGPCGGSLQSVRSCRR
jgi:hypothetical protein